MSTPEGFHYFINHIKQRLIIILDHNTRSGLDPCPSDILLLRELFETYENGAIDTFSDVEVNVDTVQQRLFSPDTSSDKK